MNKVLQKYKYRVSIKDITTIACLSTLLFAQEQLLSILPNVQLTIFLILLFSKKIGFKKTTIIILIHVILDNLLSGYFNPLFVISMFIAYLWTPLLNSFIFKKINNPILLALISVICSFLYCWTFILPYSLLFNIKPSVYLIGDIIFELLLALSSFISTLMLYPLVNKAINGQMRHSL